jgi:predicted heme/steroid binding protein
MAPPVSPLPEASVVASASSWTSAALIISVFVGLATVGLIAYAHNDAKTKKSSDKAQEEAEEDDDFEEGVTQEIPPEKMPEGGIFTMKSIEPFNGVELPMCMGVCGEVVNVSSSGNIRPGAGYGKLWAGRDATYSLATLSLDANDANRMDFKLEDFTADQQKALAGWYKHFTTKYPVIGKMKEYEGWDFSTIHEQAKSEKPFAPASGSGDSAKDTEPASKTEQPTPKAEEANAAPAELPENAQVFRKGARVQVINQADQLNHGRIGILQGFEVTRNCFEVQMEDTHDAEYFAPSSLTTDVKK